MQKVTVRLLVVVASVSMSPVFAQTNAVTVAQSDGAGATGTTPQNTQGANADVLEEVMVTAQKRAESEQKVPITMTTVSSDDLKSLHIETVQDLQFVTPGMTTGKTAYNSLTYIRGVGQLSANPGIEQPVAQYIDGVYIASTQGSVTQLNNIERIEVLKGPQGTLFGRNATGGVINIVTRNPVANPSVEGDIGYGNYDDVSSHIYATGGLTDNLAADVALLYSTEHGYGINLPDGDRSRKDEQFAARSKWLWNPGEDTTVTVVGSYSHSDGGLGVYALAPGAVGFGGYTSPGFYNTQGTPQTTRLETKGGSIKIEHDLHWARIVNIAGYEDVDVFQRTENDGTPYVISGNTALISQRTFTNELQLVSQDLSWLQWITGLFFMRDESESDLNLLTAAAVLPPPPPTPSTLGGELRNTSVSPFAQATVDILPKLHLTLGARYTRDRLKYHEQLFRNNAPAPVSDVREGSTFGGETYRAAINYDVTDRMMAFASYNRGWKAGGYNLFSANDPPFKPETLNAYEGGVKSQWYNNRLRINASVFHYDYANLVFRGSTFNPLTGTNLVRIFNAASAKVDGLDMDFAFAPAKGTVLSGGLEYLNARYSDFPGAQFTTSPSFGKTVGVRNAAGNRLNLSPRFAGNLAVHQDLTRYLSVSVNYAYKSEFYFEPDNRITQGAYGLVNATITWQPVGSNWHVDLWGENLNAAKYIITAVGTGPNGDLFAPGTPRTYGVRVGAHL